MGMTNRERKKERLALRVGACDSELFDNNKKILRRSGIGNHRKPPILERPWNVGIPVGERQIEDVALLSRENVWTFLDSTGHSAGDLARVIGVSTRYMRKICSRREAGWEKVCVTKGDLVRVQEADRKKNFD